MAASTFPHFPLQNTVIQPQIAALPLFPSSNDVDDFSDRADRALAALVPFSSQVQASNLFSFNKANESNAAVADLRSASLLGAFPLQRAYLGAFAANPVGANAAGLSIGDIYLNTTDSQIRLYTTNSGNQPVWVGISSLFSPAAPMDVTQGIRYARRVRRTSVSPVNPAGFSLNLNAANYFKFATNVSTAISFSYPSPTAFGPDALSFSLEVDILSGGSLTFPSGRVYFANNLTSVSLSPGFKYLLRFYGSRNADNFLVSVRKLNTLMT